MLGSTPDPIIPLHNGRIADSIASSLKGADITMGNLEGVLLTFFGTKKCSKESREADGVMSLECLNNCAST